MKPRTKALLIFLLAVVVCLIAFFVVRRASQYAPPRDENTELPFTENLAPEEEPSQSDVFKDAGGWINQRETPLGPFFQSNAMTGTDMGEFVGLESSAGPVPMTVIPTAEQYEYPSTSNVTTTGEYIPAMTSLSLPPLSSLV